MRKVAKKVCELSLFSQLSAPIKSGVNTYFDICFEFWCLCLFGWIVKREAAEPTYIYIVQVHTWYTILDSIRYTGRVRCSGCLDGKRDLWPSCGAVSQEDVTTGIIGRCRYPTDWLSPADGQPTCRQAKRAKSTLSSRPRGAPSKKEYIYIYRIQQPFLLANS